MPFNSTMSVEERFWSKVDTTGDCWIWTSAIVTGGYGVLHIGNKNIKAHRLAWEFERGEIPEGLFVLHRCDTPNCVRIDHLFLGTHDDNMQDMVQKGRSARSENHGQHIHPERTARGGNHGKAKLNEEKVRCIKQYIREGRTHADIADQYGVSVGTINNIAQGINWKHVT